MRGLMKYVSIGLAAASVLLLIACNMPGITGDRTVPDGYGRVKVEVAGAQKKALERTALPSTEVDMFKELEFTFIDQAEGADTDGELLVPDVDGYFILKPGKYKVAVNAYAEDPEDSNELVLVASGTSDVFTVRIGVTSQTPVQVKLTPPEDMEGEGTLTYSVIAPENADAVTITLIDFDGFETDLTVAVDTDGVTYKGEKTLD